MSVPVAVTVSSSTPASVSVGSVGAPSIAMMMASIPLGQKGKANGVAELDSTGKVPAAELPAITSVPPGWLDATTITGVDKTGVADSTAGLIAAIKKAYEEQITCYIPSGKYKIGTGGTGLTLGSSLKINLEGFGYKGLSIFCDPDVIFQGQAALGTNAVVDLVPGELGLFWQPVLQFGIIETASEKGRCLKLGASSCGLIGAKYLKGGKVSLEVVSLSANTFFTGENRFLIQRIEPSSGPGELAGEAAIRLMSEEADGPLQGVQANEFQIGVILCGPGSVFGESCTCGIEVDLVGAKNSRWNYFTIGSIANAGLYAVLNRGKDNRYTIGISTACVVADIFAAARCYARGFFDKGCTIETGVRPDLTNELVPLGPTASPIPLPETAGVDLTNKQERKVSVVVTTSTIATIRSNGSPIISLSAGGAATVPVSPGESIGWEKTTEVKAKAKLWAEVATSGKVWSPQEHSGTVEVGKTVKNLTKALVEKLVVGEEVEAPAGVLEPGTKIEAVEPAVESGNIKLDKAAKKAESVTLKFKTKLVTGFTKSVTEKLVVGMTVESGGAFKIEAPLPTITAIVSVAKGEIEVSEESTKTKAESLTLRTTTLTGVTTTGIFVGAHIEGPGIPTEVNATVEEINEAKKEIRMNVIATETKENELTFVNRPTWAWYLI